MSLTFGDSESGSDAIGSMGKKKPHNLYMPLMSGHKKSICTIRCCMVDICSMGKKEPNNLCMPILTGDVESICTIRCCMINICFFELQKSQKKRLSLTAWR